ncbi:hypothetical protein CHS0354_004224 [Potamilus streckersoni]|uniref:Beta-sarcoglycan n=1 Tax=Potamilus streckersoni TaxID=2493646 RepID=A0AAE0RRS7_9BIVA|nr:hypothetical protein CHS0354_004224 [Potamilus streckersoni]
MEEPTFRRRSNRDSANFHAGYVPVDETYIQETGIRGKKSFCLYTVLIFITIIALLNSAVSVALIYFLHITHHGLESAEFLPGGHLLRVLSDIEVANVDLYHGMLGGRRDMDLDIMGHSVSLNSSTGESVTVNMEGILMKAKGFQMIKDASNVLFSTDDRPRMGFKRVKNSKMREMQVKTMYNRTGVEDLHVESHHDLQIIGMEGISMMSEGNITIHAQGDLDIISLSGGIEMESLRGTFFHSNIPSARAGDTSSGSAYKVCVCMPEGRLFVVLYTGHDSGCDKASEVQNPCSQT